MPEDTLSNEDALQKYIDYNKALNRLKKEYPGYDKDSPGERYAISVLKNYLSKIADIRDEFAERVDQKTLYKALDKTYCFLVYNHTHFSKEDLDDIERASGITCNYDPQTEMFEFRFKIVNEHIVYIRKSEMRLTAALSGYLDGYMNLYRENVLIQLSGKLDKKPVQEPEFER